MGHQDILHFLRLCSPRSSPWLMDLSTGSCFEDLKPEGWRTEPDRWSSICWAAGERCRTRTSEWQGPVVLLLSSCLLLAKKCRYWQLKVGHECLREGAWEGHRPCLPQKCSGCGSVTARMILDCAHPLPSLPTSSFGQSLISQETGLISTQ